MTIDQLELSVRTSSLLQELGVSTLGEILALQKIQATPMSIAELTEVFSELEVRFEGEFVSTAGSADNNATGPLEERWETIKSWLLEHHPRVYEEFLPPATEAQIEEAEKSLGCRLPEDYRRFLRLHNGQVSGGAMVMTCSLFPVEKLHEAHKRYSSVFDGDNPPPTNVDLGIRAVEHSEGWIPIGNSARGRDYLCLDMDPAEEGTVGQVILTAVDFNDHRLLAPNFADFLSHFFEELQTGEILLNEEE